MTGGDEQGELQALEEARARLEASLMKTDGWVNGAQAEAALAENPTYRAWSHVSDAIGILRNAQRTARREALSPLFPHPVPPEATEDGATKPHADPSGDPPTDMQTRIGDGHPSDAQPASDTERGRDGETGERADGGRDDPAVLAGKNARAAAASRASEASVTFIIREAATTRRPQAEPEDTPLATRPPFPAAPAANGRREEAEVLIVTPEDLDDPSVQHTRTMRRFLRALSGP